MSDHRWAPNFYLVGGISLGEGAYFEGLSAGCLILGASGEGVTSVHI